MVKTRLLDLEVLERRVLLNGTPQLAAGIPVYDGASPLEVGYESVPAVADWNNDGNNDLVVGQYTYGYINLFLNQGTNDNPVFDGSSLINSGGTPITTSYG